MLSEDDVRESLASVDDPEIGRPITDLGMVDDIAIDGSTVAVRIKLTISGCPLKDRIEREVTEAIVALDGVEDVRLSFTSMTDGERQGLASRLQQEMAGTGAQRTVPFAQPDSPTRVLAVASGKGGVGKSSVTANLAVALAQRGYRVGVLDADIWGYSIPRMLGVEGRPVVLDEMVMPLQAHGCRVISIGFFLEADKSVIWRGPMLHKALTQFLTDVYWGELDYLLCDLPPGTGDITLSMAQTLPGAEMLVVTTPQAAAQKVAQRAGHAADQTGMKVVGVVENMATFTCPECNTEHDLFGTGGGEELSRTLNVPLLGRVPIDPRLRDGSDHGVPLLANDHESPTARSILEVAEHLGGTNRPLAGRRLPLAVG